MIVKRIIGAKNIIDFGSSVIEFKSRSTALKREEEEQQNFSLLPFVLCEHKLLERISEIVDISTNWALQVDRMLQPVMSSDIHRSSQTGESTGDRPAFWDFGPGSSYNSSKQTGSRIIKVTLSIELI